MRIADESWRQQDATVALLPDLLEAQAFVERSIAQAVKVHDRPATVEQLQAALPDRSALVLFANTDDRQGVQSEVAYVVRPDREVQRVPVTPDLDEYLRLSSRTQVDPVALDQASDQVRRSTLDGTSRVGNVAQGLRMAFALAGVEHQVLSLWPVDDAATTRLMTHFYRYLRRGDPALALALAQRRLLAEQRRRAGHGLPRTWAAFVAAGPPP